MEETLPVRGSRFKRVAAVMAILFLGMVVGWIMKPAPSTFPSVFMPILKASAPVAIAINFRPVVTTEEQVVTRMSGTAHYTFTNLTESAINVSFPPTRVFGYSSGSHTPSEVIPEFAAEERIVTIPGGESVHFEDEHGMQFLGDPRVFLRGGPGWIGFVFEQPDQGATEVPFCTGTVFSTYTVHPIQ